MASDPIRDPAQDHLLTPQNCAFLVIDYQPVQVNSIASMERQRLVTNSRPEAKMISVAQLFCELQRDWARKQTVPGFMTLFFDMQGSAGVAAAED